MPILIERGADERSKENDSGAFHDIHQFLWSLTDLKYDIMVILIDGKSGLTQPRGFIL